LLATYRPIGPRRRCSDSAVSSKCSIMRCWRAALLRREPIAPM
jgi:hypothetical protein